MTVQTLFLSRHDRFSAAGADTIIDFHTSSLVYISLSVFVLVSLPYPEILD
jgi:hypothetical protein